MQPLVQSAVAALLRRMDIYSTTRVSLRVSDRSPLKIRNSRKKGDRKTHEDLTSIYRLNKEFGNKFNRDDLI